MPRSLYALWWFFIYSSSFHWIKSSNTDVETALNSSTVQNRMPVASKEHHIDEEREADAEKVARDQADEERRGFAV